MKRGTRTTLIGLTLGATVLIGLEWVGRQTGRSWSGAASGTGGLFKGCGENEDLFDEEGLANFANATEAQVALALRAGQRAGVHQAEASILQGESDAVDQNGAVSGCPELELSEEGSIQFTGNACTGSSGTLYDGTAWINGGLDRAYEALGADLPEHSEPLEWEFDSFSLTGGPLGTLQLDGTVWRSAIADAELYEEQVDLTVKEVDGNFSSTASAHCTQEDDRCLITNGAYGEVEGLGSFKVMGHHGRHPDPFRGWMLLQGMDDYGLNDGSEVVSPLEGKWDYGGVETVAETCELDDELLSFVFGPDAGFKITEVQADSFSLILNGVNASTECALFGLAWTCDEMSGQTDRSEWGVVLTTEVRVWGILSDETTTTGTLEVDVTCDGSGCGTAQNLYGIKFPCQFIFSTNAVRG